ncbi:MAG: DUF3093 domain-containing protein [Candidatus Sericytochromatia bacterium]
MSVRQGGRPVARYDERLAVPWWWWAVAAAMTASLGVALGYPLGVATGVMTFVAAFAAAFAFLAWVGAMRVVVTDDELRAGRGRLPLGVIADVRALDPARTRLLLGPRLDPAAHLALRGYVPTAVQVRIADPDDAAPYWLVSTRCPDRLAQVLREVRV